jgi:hypothetical protein
MLHHDSPNKCYNMRENDVSAGRGRTVFRTRSFNLRCLGLLGLFNLCFLGLLGHSIFTFHRVLG